MSKHSSLLIRVQSPEGTKRVDVDASDTTCHLFEKIHDTFDLSSFNFALYKEKNNKNEISSSKTNTVRSVGLRHGDMIYLAPISGAGAALFPEENSNNKPYGEPVSDPVPSTSGTSTNAVANSRPSTSFSSSFNRFSRSSVSIKEDEVDLLLYKLDGKVERKRDDKLCRHNANSRCVHCSSIEPFDEAYLHEHNIKHMSFHTYLRKMTSGVDQGKFLALEDISCHIKSGCKDHPPWPKGICSKCQPSAITLNAQTYRHVDNVAFENTSIVEKFLDYWRITGHQRIGFLYGYYGIHSDVPLGIRATVVAIYEPPQESTRDSIRLLADDREELVEHISKSLGLRRVGWIFTDLIPEDVQKGTVKHTRNIQSHFVSAQECIMAGHFQNQHPNPCRFASSGVFGSKFVTICVTGDSSNQVHMEGYQVSNQCMALVRDNCLVPTKDAPELGYVRESSDKQYVPDVYYKEKDSYGNDVTRPARPLPVEYLLLDIPTSTPLTPHYTFNPDTTRRPFPVEHRQLEGHVQDFHALAAYLSQFAPEEFSTAIRDFHLLLYIAGMETLPMREHMTGLLEAVKREDDEAIREWRNGEQWATVEQLVAASSPPQSRPTSSAGGGLSMPGLSSGSSEWTCKYCTYVNNSEVSNCEMCSLPRSRV